MVNAIHFARRGAAGALSPVTQVLAASREIKGQRVIIHWLGRV